MDETWPTAETFEREHFELTPPLEESPVHHGVRFLVWGVVVALFAAFASLVRVHTYLGVEAVSWDKNGRDYVWSVWWRARHDMIGAAPSTAFVLVYMALIVAFLGLSGLALWLAVVAEERPSNLDNPSTAEVSTQ